MSEEKLEDKDGAAGKSNVDAIHEGAESGKISGTAGTITPVVLLIFMIFAMVVVLAVIYLKERKSGGGGVQTGDPAVAALKADLEARLSELNRQRMAIGLPPLEGGSEPIEDIASRLKNDTDTLVGLAGRFQQMLEEKDSEISRRNSDLLNLEKRWQDISLENSRLQAEMNRALLSASETDQLKRLVADIQAQRDALSQELADTRAKLASAAGAVDANAYADLQRRYDESLRSKEFFENRVKELEE